MPTFYTKHLTGTIQECVEASLACTPQEQLQLYEELAIVRTMSLQAVKLWDAAQQSDVDEATKRLAESIAYDSLVRSVKVCETAAKVDAMSKDKFSIHHLSAVVAQIVRIAYEVFDDDMEKAKEFERHIREQVRMPGDVQGTTKTPDMDVDEMDASVPRCSE